MGLAEYLLRHPEATLVVKDGQPYLRVPVPERPRRRKPQPHLGARVRAVGLTLSLLGLTVPPPPVFAGQQLGEDSVYAREMGKDKLLFYVAAGNGIGQVEYLCEADPGKASSAAAWRIQKFVYDSSNRLSTIRWAGGSDDQNDICDDRASLSYP